MRISFFIFFCMVMITGMIPLSGCIFPSPGNDQESGNHLEIQARLVPLETIHNPQNVTMIVRMTVNATNTGSEDTSGIIRGRVDVTCPGQENCNGNWLFDNTFAFTSIPPGKTKTYTANITLVMTRAQYTQVLQGQKLEQRIIVDGDYLSFPGEPQK